MKPVFSKETVEAVREIFESDTEAEFIKAAKTEMNQEIEK